MQIAVAEFARHVAGMDGANSTEFDPETPYPVVDLLPEQKEVSDMGGTMRLGADPVKLHDGTRAREIFGEAVIYKRHRHRYEVNNQLRRRLEDEGLVCGGTSPDERLVEIIELPDHPFFVASQFHPEFNSRPNRPEPLFREFVGAAARLAAERGDGPATEETEVEAAPPTGRRTSRVAPPRADPSRARGGVGEHRIGPWPPDLDEYREALARLLGPLRRQLGARARLPLVGDAGSLGERLVERLDPQPGDTVLELAGGHRRHRAFSAAERIGDDGKLISTDFAPAMVEAARRAGEARGPRERRVPGARRRAHGPRRLERRRRRSAASATC